MPILAKLTRRRPPPLTPPPLDRETAQLPRARLISAKRKESSRHERHIALRDARGDPPHARREAHRSHRAPATRAARRGGAGYWIRSVRRGRVRARRTRLAHHRPEAGHDPANGSPATTAHHGRAGHQRQRPARRLDTGKRASRRCRRRCAGCSTGSVPSPGWAGSRDSFRRTRPTSCRTAASFWRPLTAIRLGAATTSSTSPAAIGARRSPWLSCCTAARSRPTTSPPARG